MSHFADTFKALLKQGMSPAEAKREFDPEQWKSAVSKAIDDEGAESELFQLAIRASHCERNERDMEQAIELWLAGWKSEKPSENSDIMSWYWRRPARRKGSKGMMFLSTQQAFNAMKKEKQ